LSRNVNEFGGFERVGERNGDAIGIDAIRFSVAIETERRHDGDDALAEQSLEKIGVHAFDFAGEEMVHSLDDAEGMGDDRVGAGGAKIVGGKAFENFVRETIGRSERDLQCAGIGDARAIEIGGLELAFIGQRFNLRGSAVDEDDADVERAEDGDIEEKIRKVFAGDNGSVHAEDENFFAELRDVLEDAPEVGQFHFRSFVVVERSISREFLRGFKLKFEPYC
jgi:hypothetical protein